MLVGGSESFGERGDAGAKFAEVDSGRGGGFWKEAAFRHAGDCVGLENHGLAGFGEKDVDAGVDFAAEGTVRGEGSVLDPLGRLFSNLCRAGVFGSAATTHPWVFVGHVVEAVLRLNLYDRKRGIIEDSDGELPAFDEALDEKFIGVFASVGDGIRNLGLSLHHVDTDA